jgi:hypothetical protein
MSIYLISPGQNMSHSAFIIQFPLDSDIPVLLSLYTQLIRDIGENSLILVHNVMTFTKVT